MMMINSIPNTSAPYGSMLSFFKGKTNREIYIQLSKDERSPTWVRLGFLLEEILEKYLTDEEFIKKILSLKETHREIHFENIKRELDNK